MKTLPVLRLTSDAVLPTRAHADDAGLDLYGLEEVTLNPREGRALKTGVALALREGCVGLVADRSSMAKRGLKTAGGVIDAGYRGEIQIVIWNMSDQPQHLKKGDRIAQLLILPIETPMPQEVTELPGSQRGEKGFGSSGR
ncbi:MAG: dUTP diphosphatase [Bdellovibrionota bacterium]